MTPCKNGWYNVKRYIDGSESFERYIETGKKLLITRDKLLKFSRLSKVFYRDKHDFGSGYASFSDMSNYSIDCIKIDKSIIYNIENEKSRGILAGLIKIGHELKIEVLCEGVETKQQAEMLRKMNCDMIQGCYYYRAMSSEI